jgi:hypothetical protein
MIGFAFPIVSATSAYSQGTSINDKVVKYMAANSGNRVGGGESTHAVTEALRSAGAAFTEIDLGSDYPEQGDRMWGTPVKVVSVNNGKLVDSNPTSQVLAGDVIQYKDSTFVYVTNNGRKQTTTTVTLDQHTAVVATVNAKSLFPTKVYQQNAPAIAANIETRKLTLDSVGFESLKSGSVIIYRPRARSDEQLKYQISVVNNTSATKIPTLKSGLKTVSRLTLDASNSPSSYTATSANSISSGKGLSLVLPNGESIDVVNGGSYEIYKRSSGLDAIRRISP